MVRLPAGVTSFSISSCTATGPGPPLPLLCIVPISEKWSPRGDGFCGKDVGYPEYPGLCAQNTSKETFLLKIG